MTVGQIISRTLGVVVQRFGALIGLWALYFAMQIAATVGLGLFVGASASLGWGTGSMAGMTAGMIFGTIIFYVVYFMVYFAQVASLTAASTPLRRVGFGEALSTGLRSAPTMLGIIILLMIGYFVLALLVGVVGGVLSMAGKAGIVVFGLLALVAAVFLFCRLSMVNAVVAIDHVVNPITAITRSWTITKGKVLTIFGSMLVFGFACLVLFAAAFAPFYTSFKAATETGGMPNMATLGFGFVAVVIVAIFLAIVMSALISVIHGELIDGAGEDTAEIFA